MEMAVSCLLDLINLWCVLGIPGRPLKGATEDTMQIIVRKLNSGMAHLTDRLRELPLRSATIP